MTFDATPTDLLAGMAEDGTDLTIPLASIPELTAGEADAASGDSRKIIYAFLARFHAWYDGLAEADRPGKLAVFKSGPNTIDGVTKTVFTVECTMDAGSIDVADE